MSTLVSTNTSHTCKAKFCEVGGGGRILPLFGDDEQRWQKAPFRALLYGAGLLWCFMGVAIVSDIFMGAIERITSKKVKIFKRESGKWVTLKVWNDTVANLTLMALGSSAPEILLSVIELCTNNFLSGDLGPSTIVGSAAFNLLCISAVCVMAIPEDEVRKIRDVSVFAITASFSIFAYAWLYFIVVIITPDEIDIAEGALTFIFFPILVILAFAADRGYLTFPGAFSDEEHHSPPMCAKSHEMKFLGTSRDTDGWGCDGRFLLGGCRSGITGFYQTKGVNRWRCEICDFDLCAKCVESDRRKLSTPHIISCNVSREELANIELRILQQHGDSLSDEQLARLIQKEHLEPPSRANYRVQATRQMVGGRKITPLNPDENTAYSMTSVVPMDDHRSSGSSSVKPAVCPAGHNMRSFLTQKANFNCDMCQKRFPTGTLLFGCRSCNFDCCADCKSKFVKADVIIEFACPVYTVLESIGTLQTQVLRSGDLNQKVSVQYKTRDGTAVQHDDYVPMEGVIEFEEGQNLKQLPVQIVDDTSYEDDEEFYIDLMIPSGDAEELIVKVGEYRTATIKVVDDDLPGILSFAEESIGVTENIENKVITVTVKRRDGSNGQISCKYTTEDGTAVAGAGYLAVSGSLVFESGQMSRDVQLTILSGHHYDHSEDFHLILTEPSGGAVFDASTDGGSDSCVCTIVVVADEAAKGRVDRVMKVLEMDWDKAEIGSKTWRDQFWSALLVNGGEDDVPSCFDWAMHGITVFWKVIFACIPPTDFCGGWLCFVCSLIMIGGVTAVIGELAMILGCTLNVPDKITAITFVALGTSLPDTFASKTAAEQDPYADASLGNITGSNSVNVFLGLGLPWVIGSIYWRIQGKTDTWKDEYRVQYPEFLEGEKGMFVVIGGDLGLGVAIFSACAILAIGGLSLRRKLYGGELGGPQMPRYITAVGLVSLWFIYIGLSSYFVLKNQKDCNTR